MFSSDFCTGITLALFHSDGSWPDLRLALKSEVKLPATAGTTIPKSFADVPSTPVALLTSSEASNIIVYFLYRGGNELKFRRSFGEVIEFSW